MKYLVLWIKANPPTTSILDENQVKITEKFVRAKWGKSWQDVKVIEENDDEKWLSSLAVSTDGHIINSECKSPEDIIAKKRCSQKNKRVVTAQKKKLIEKSDSGYVQDSSIFSECDAESQKEGASYNDHERKKNDISCDEEYSENDKSDEEEEVDDTSGKLDETKEVKKVRQVYDSCHFCTEYFEDSSFEDKFIAIAKSALSHLENLITEYTGENKKSDNVKLAPDVSINRYVLYDLKRIYGHDSNALTRALLKELIGEEQLSTMTGTTIPRNIFNAVEKYVNTRLPKRKRLNLTQFKRVITNYCTSLKEKLKNKKNNKVTPAKDGETPAKEMVSNAAEPTACYPKMERPKVIKIEIVKPANEPKKSVKINENVITKNEKAENFMKKNEGDENEKNDQQEVSGSEMPKLQDAGNDSFQLEKGDAALENSSRNEQALSDSEPKGDKSDQVYKELSIQNKIFEDKKLQFLNTDNHSDSILNATSIKEREIYKEEPETIKMESPENAESNGIQVQPQNSKTTESNEVSKRTKQNGDLKDKSNEGKIKSDEKRKKKKHKKSKTHSKKHDDKKHHKKSKKRKRSRSKESNNRKNNKRSRRSSSSSSSSSSD